MLLLMGQWETVLIDILGPGPDVRVRRVYRISVTSPLSFRISTAPLTRRVPVSTESPGFTCAIPFRTSTLVMIPGREATRSRGVSSVFLVPRPPHPGFPDPDQQSGAADFCRNPDNIRKGSEHGLDLLAVRMGFRHAVEDLLRSQIVQNYISTFGLISLDMDVPDKKGHGIQKKTQSKIPTGNIFRSRWRYRKKGGRAVP